MLGEFLVANWGIVGVGTSVLICFFLKRSLEKEKKLNDKLLEALVRAEKEKQFRMKMSKKLATSEERVREKARDKVADAAVDRSNYFN